MDPLALGTVVFVAVVVLIALFSARANAGKPLSDFGERDVRAARPSADSQQLEYQDLNEMLDATNARRRAHGLPERTHADAAREFGGDH